MILGPPNARDYAPDGPDSILYIPNLGSIPKVAERCVFLFVCVLRVFVCVFVCVCVNLCVFMYIYIYIYIYICMY